ncbi:TetR/AcrR family transcriptional regulator [Pseudomonas sp. B1-22]|uniref:TetR/AcrR family transcriptional regulator n=1 Tax=Pseudomonas sp. B1-22 TaxID=3141456 RepID=UPI003D287E11
MARLGAELRRQDFVEATVKVVAEHGVAKATTRRIAAAAGSPLASLHYLFHTKEDLFYAVFELLYSVPQQALEHSPASATLADSATGILRHLINWFIAHPEVAAAQPELFNWALRNDPELANKVYVQAIDGIESIFRELPEDQLDDHLVMAVSRLLVQLVDGLVVAWCVHRDNDRLQAETEYACQALSLLASPRTTS